MRIATAGSRKPRGGSEAKSRSRNGQPGNDPAANQEQRTDRVDTRIAILDATEQIMLKEGYCGVSSRKVASAAGLKSQLLHYYFRSMDDLFIAVFQRLEDRFSEAFAHAMASPRPIRELWALNMDATSTRLIFEFNALASHQPTIRSLIARSVRNDRVNLTAALTGFLKRSGKTTDQLPPKILAFLLSALTRTLSADRTLGATEAHDDVLAFVEAYIKQLEETPIVDPN